ncbi:hypothetical protein HD806DRAFT_494764 [Xylariaceae sp. AK1471]|nr:hypothetical protein HD806DRAFT_494764 [Xylariaceae sp. AK1471]
MPPFPVTPLLNSLIDRDTTVNASTLTSAAQVVCAWPVSGQYGFGTRILYYVLVATCVLARRTEWLRNACLAAALLLPAVAAIHAVVLAAVHVDNAVDMDIYGAFQICSIGILAAPITVYNSKTYFNDPGRNIIFLWTGLLLAGMLSLTIEFFRTQTHGCPFNDVSGPIDPAAYASCNLTCTTNYAAGGPFSPLRQQASNNIYVIPAPKTLTFGAVTLLAAASSVPPVLTLIFTWEKILEINWKRRFAREETEINEPIEGTNGATPKMITFINGAIRNFLSSIQIPLFSGIVVVLLVLGELNFWSTQVSYQTEPFTSVGQWANVVATALVVLGSLFYVQKQREVNEQEDVSSDHSHDGRSSKPRHSTQSNRDHEIMHTRTPRTPPRVGPDQTMDSSGSHGNISRSAHLDTSRSAQSEEHSGGYFELEDIATHPTYESLSPTIWNKHRNKVANLLNTAAEYLGTPAADRYDNSAFRREGQHEFPAIPGEEGRNASLERIRDRYRISREHDDVEGIITPGLSRVNSYSSFRTDEGGPTTNRGVSPSRLPRSPSRSNTTPVEQNRHPSIELNRITTSPVPRPSRGRVRRDTLEVPNRPSPAHLRLRSNSSSSTTSLTMVLDTQGSPRIVVSAEPEEPSLTTPTMSTSLSGPH